MGGKGKSGSLQDDKQKGRQRQGQGGSRFPAGMTNKKGNDKQKRRPIASASAAVVGGGFGVDQEAVDFGGIELECAFEGGDDRVDAGHGEVVGEGAVAGDLDVVGDVVVGVFAEGMGLVD